MKGEGPEAEWWVRPIAFCRWAATMGDCIGHDRAAIFAALIREESPAQMPSVRRRVLENGYSTPELDAALAAIAEFWLPVQENGGSPPNNKVVLHWLMTKHGMNLNAAKRIDVLIRPPSAKPGGRKRITQKTQ